MTLQQLEYIIALAQYGHFSEAAFSQNITQPTLSATIAKLENELDVAIFDRTKHPIVPTPIGQKIIDQAKVTLMNMKRIPEIAHDEKRAVKGNVKVGVIPTIAPYIVPNFFTIAKKLFPGLSVTILELPTIQQVTAIKRGDLDISILATRHPDEELLEIPIYKESLIMYASKGHRYLNENKITPEMFKGNDLWVLKSEHCLSTQIFKICHLKKDFTACYSAGNIYTLISIVDAQGGYTIIPELHYNMLTDEQKMRVRRFVDPEPVRTVSLYIRNDYFQEGILNAVAKCICDQIPKNKIEERILKGPIRI